MDWMIVKHSWTSKVIGAVGFLDNQIVAVVAFYDDKDADHDGKVSLGERAGSILFSMRGRAAAEVISQAYADPAIAERDPGINEMRGRLLTAFASGLLVEGAYQAWFAFGISKAAGAIAETITTSAIKSFFIKKGMEKAVKEAYMAAMRQ